jgi:hypothetical protein
VRGVSPQHHVPRGFLGGRPLPAAGRRGLLDRPEGRQRGRAVRGRRVSVPPRQRLPGPGLPRAHRHCQRLQRFDHFSSPRRPTRRERGRRWGIGVAVVLAACQLHIRRVLGGGVRGWLGGALVRGLRRGLGLQRVQGTVLPLRGGGRQLPGDRERLRGTRPRRHPLGAPVRRRARAALPPGTHEAKGALPTKQPATRTSGRGVKTVHSLVLHGKAWRI